MNIDWQKIRHNKKFEIPILIILFVIAVFTINNAVTFLNTPVEVPFWARQMELIANHNDQLIKDSKKQIEAQLNNLSSKDLVNLRDYELKNVSPADAKILSDCDNTIQNLKSYYFTNAIIKAKKFGNKRAGRAELRDFKSVVEKNKYIHNYDKIMNEIEDNFKIVAKDDVK